MEKLKVKLWDELEEIARKPEMGAGDLELAHKLTDTIKNLDKICMLEDDGGEGYSSANRGRHLVRAHYSRDGGMDARNGYSGTRRDSRGRYSRDDGRSEMMEHLEAAWDTAPERDRETIRRFMDKLENA